MAPDFEYFNSIIEVVVTHARLAFFFFNLIFFFLFLLFNTIHLTIHEKKNTKDK